MYIMQRSFGSVKSDSLLRHYNDMIENRTDDIEVTSTFVLDINQPSDPYTIQNHYITVTVVPALSYIQA